MRNPLKFLLAGCILLSFLVNSFAQETFPYNGVADERTSWYALTGATVYTNHDTKIENATLIIREGKVEAVGAGINIPDGAIQIDATGKFIYPSFIDLIAEYGIPEAQAPGKRPRAQPQMLSNKTGAYSWNESLKPEFHAFEHFNPAKEQAGKMRKAGFGAVLSHQTDGIARGTGALVLLGEEVAHEMLLKEKAANFFSFRKGVATQNYPNSLMGAIALLRQTYYDADWYQNHGKAEERNLSLEAWNDNATHPQIFIVGNKLEALRAAKVGQEFNIKYIIKGAGDSYQRINEVKAATQACIVPLNFPKAYDVEDPYDAMLIDMAQLKHWELAPTNPAAVANAGIPMAITFDGLKSDKEFWANLRKAIEYGLSESDALKALTTTPAAMMKASDMLGSLDKGKIANFIVSDKHIFESKSQIVQNWVNGKPHQIQSDAWKSLIGEYELKVDNETLQLKVTEGRGSPSAKVFPAGDTTGIKATLNYQNQMVNLIYSKDKKDGYVRLSGLAKGTFWSGKGQLENGEWVDWQADYQNANKTRNKGKKKSDKSKELGPVTYPFQAYGWTEMPTQNSYLIRNATVWTNEEEGIMENTDVLVVDGKIQVIGKDLGVKDMMVIDATGKHLTPGIIDEHSHIAVSRGVNEGTQASSAEVRIGDVINSDDVNIYRQLSGGVTTSQLLHGSANPIGGQSGIIKLRWGYAPEDMKFEGAAPFIKFALGENVKQSNWGDNNTTRFPQTRMGVEQVFDNYFKQAQLYGEKKASGKPYRMDLELEALLEIINSERFITCHSYQQGEINMLMKVAERFGFRVNTFTHILEGYKVADKMAEHGAGGSSFSDWWAYKYEVINAIPYNGAIMHEEGVLVAFNSDDAEMARRLNQEAAKAIQHGGLSEEDAFKFVTLNPAKLLHIDDRVGSIKVGKDADLVIWSDHPLSVYAKADMTFVDGIKFFDREADQVLQAEVEAERNRIVQKMLQAKKSGAKMQPVNGRRQMHYHCDDNKDEMK